MINIFTIYHPNLCSYPPLANGLGIVFALSSVSAIPLVGLWMFIKADGSTWSEVGKTSILVDQIFIEN
jgi:hypothetical protein